MVTGQLISIILGSVLALVCLIAASRVSWRKRLIDDCPTSKTQGVFIGLVELKGTAESEAPLTSYLAEKRCVQYEWQVEEHWSRTVTETHVDAHGHVQTTTRTESGWKKVAGGAKSIPFYLKDDAGVIRIMPDGASIQPLNVFDKTCSPADSLYYGKGPQNEIPDTTHRRRFRETALPLHTQLYVMGQARERQDIVAPEIAYDKKAAMFLISTRTERQLSTGYLRWLWFWLVLGLLFAFGGSLAWNMLRESSADITWQPYVIGISGFAVAAAVGWLWTVYNSLVNLHHRVEQGWSLVDVQLKRRNDLMPNLVAAVEGFRRHEAGVQNLLAELRGQQETASATKGVVPMLAAVFERYPDLKAGESFLKLQKSLSETEQRIALARDYFNDIATFYNNRLAIIPDRFVALLAGLLPSELIGAADIERAPVSVNLAS